MPLTNAQKQAAYAKRRKAKLQRLARLEAALERIIAHDDPDATDADLAQMDKDGGWYSAMRLCGDIARAALADTPPVFSGTHEE